MMWAASIYKNTVVRDLPRGAAGSLGEGSKPSDYVPCLGNENLSFRLLGASALNLFE